MSVVFRGFRSGPTAGLLVALCVACGSGPSGPTTPPVELLNADGPFAVGRQTVELVDSGRTTAEAAGVPGVGSRRLVADLYYPADAGLVGMVYEGATPKNAERRLPVVLVAHGLFGSRMNFVELNRLLASKGYLVVAVDFPSTNFATFATGDVYLPDLFEQPKDLSHVLDALEGKVQGMPSEIVAAADTDRVGVVGHSYGGATVLLASTAAPVLDLRIDVAVALAPFSCFFSTESLAGGAVPTLVLHGTNDAILVLEWHKELAERSGASMLLVEIDGGDHMGFTSDPTRPSGERDLEFASVVAGAEEVALGQLGQFGVAALATVPGVDLARCALRPLIAPPGSVPAATMAFERQRELGHAATIAHLNRYLDPEGAVYVPASDSTSTAYGAELLALGSELAITGAASVQ
jgi:predicted dienelactone hydrolase